MRLPSGYGGCVKMPGNRRKPWRVRVTIRWETDDTGKRKQIYQTIGYFSTKEEGLQALAEFHNDPGILDNTTFSELYERWSAEKFPTISTSNVHGYKASYALCDALKPMRFRDIRRNHLQAVIDASGKSYQSLRKLRVLFSQLFQYAMQNDICDKDYSAFVDIAKHKDPDAEQIHKPFTRDELDAIIANAPRSKWIAAILMMIYSGVRVGELLALRKEDVCINEQYFSIRKSKTKAGVRKVPIADSVLPYWHSFMAEDGEFLISNTLLHQIDDSTYRETYFTKPLAQIGITDHRPHDTRHTCISLMTAAHVDRILIKRIVGHQGEDVTDKVYTHYDIDQLIQAVNQIDSVI